MLDAGDAGASVAVFVDGEPVVDVWGGFFATEAAGPLGAIFERVRQCPLGRARAVRAGPARRQSV